MTSGLGEIEFLADADRPGGWLVTIDRIRQSYVDTDDPTYLDFEYVQAFADVLDALTPDQPDAALAVTHVGGGACTLARYVGHVRPGSPQIVLEPDAELTRRVRERLPFGRGVRVRIREIDGRSGVGALKDASADVLVLDAFLGGRVPPELTSREFVADAARVLGPEGVLLVNVADGPPNTYSRRLAATLATEFTDVLATADPAVFKGRRFGNVVLAASRSALPLAAVARAAASAPFARSVKSGAAMRSYVGAAPPLTDADPMRSPQPPDALWRVGS